MFWIALAAQMSLPLQIGTHYPDVRGVFSVDDFPGDFHGHNGSRVVYTRTTVRPDGGIDSCRVEVSSGDKKLDAYTCAIIMKRAKFEPAKWIDGSPAYGVIRVPVSWTITDTIPTDNVHRMAYRS